MPVTACGVPRLSADVDVTVQLDLADAQSLCRAHEPELDGGRIRHTLQRLEEALGQGDLVSGFESISRGRADGRHDD